MQTSTAYAPASSLQPMPQPSAPPSRAQRLAALGHCLLERLEHPLFVTDAHGAVLEANPAASRRIERREGLWIDAAGRIALRQAGRWVPLAHWQPMLASGQEITLPLDGDSSTPVQITLRAMSQGDGIPGSFGWVMGTVERVALTRMDSMKKRFRFTRTQARLAEMLCEGMRPTVAAEKLGVKISTVRTHVGQMYEKTGTHTQAQLVALLHSA
jgi:DNA-binding CsgD family transcriptional regulator